MHAPQSKPVGFHLDVSAEHITRALRENGAASFPILSPEATRRYAEAAGECGFESAAATAGRYNVAQDFDICPDVPRSSPIRELREALELRLDTLLGPAGANVLDGPLRLNDVVLQRYAAGSRGISPHRDGKRFINLVCIVVLCGSAPFAVCDDRAGSNAREVEAGPGSLILLRAPGFLGEQARPFHYVGGVASERITASFRQRVERS